MLTSLRLDILRDLRERAGLTQGEMARLCGLQGQQSHQTAGAWERGDMIPSRARRMKFIGYLWDHLGLGKEPRFFEEVWEMLVVKWGWEPISDREWAEYTHKARPSRAQSLDRDRAQMRQIEHSLTLNYDRLRPEEARNALVAWLLTNMSIFGSDKPVRYEVKLHTLEGELGKLQQRGRGS